MEKSFVVQTLRQAVPCGAKGKFHLRPSRREANECDAGTRICSMKWRIINVHSAFAEKQKAVTEQIAFGVPGLVRKARYGGAEMLEPERLDHVLVRLSRRAKLANRRFWLGSADGPLMMRLLLTLRVTLESVPVADF